MIEIVVSILLKHYLNVLRDVAVLKYVRDRAHLPV